MAVQDLQLVQLLRKEAGSRLWKVVTCALAAGVLQSATVAMVKSGLNQADGDSMLVREALIFVLLIFGYMVLLRRAIAETMGYAQKGLTSLQISLASNLRHVKTEAFEQFSVSDIYTHLLGGRDTVLEASRSMIMALSGLSMILFTSLYFLYISPLGFVIMVGIYVGGIGLYIQMESRAHRKMIKSSKAHQKFVRTMEDLLYGFKEVKVNWHKGDDLFNSSILNRAVHTTTTTVDTETRQAKAMAFATAFFFIPVGAIVFILPRLLSLESDVVVSLCAINLFTLGPIGTLVTIAPLIGRVELTLGGMNELNEQLIAQRDEDGVAPSPYHFKNISMNNLRFQYKNGNGRDAFGITIDGFSLNRGDILFVVGGNGSGKSTFMKVLSGLYYPAQGKILMDGLDVDEIGYVEYRNLFSILFTDFHLFEKLYGAMDVEEDKVQALIDTMHLSGKVELVEGNKFSTRDLSTGQRKRLALIASCLDDKEVFLFDEVAADFDPSFRKFFYEEFLPSLQANGKTVVAISHDDRYFHVADTVITMEYGKVIHSFHPGEKGEAEGPTCPVDTPEDE